MKSIKDTLWITKEWLKRLYVYPQNKIVPGEHFNYDEYWKVKRKGNLGSLGSWQIKRARLTSKIINTAAGQSVNDIGSGAGEVLKYVKEHTSITKAVCYDSSVTALEIAKQVGLETRLMDLAKEGEARKLEQADFTLLFEILEHLPGPEDVLAESLAKSNKAVLFSIPNTGFLIHRFRLFFFGKFPMQWAKHPGEHLRFWTLTDLNWWLKAQGYRSYKIHYYVGIPVLKNLWPNLFCAGLFVELSH